MAKNINVVLSLQDRFTAKMSKASYETLKFKRDLELAKVTSSKFKGVMDTVNKAVVGTTTAVGAAAIMASKSCLSAYEEFNNAMNNVAAVKGIDTLTEKGKKAFKELTQVAKDAAKEVKGTTYTDAANGLYYMALAGMDVTDKKVQSSLPSMLKAAKINGTDVKETLDAVTDSMTALGLSTEKTAEYIDVCTAVQSSSNTNMLQLNEALIKSGAGMSSLGVDYKETASLIGIMASAGLKGSEAGTFLNSQYSRLVKGLGEASKGLQALDLSIYDKTTGKMKQALPLFKEMADKLKVLKKEDRDSIMSKIGGRYRSQLETLIAGFTEVVDEEGTAYDKIQKAIKDAEEKKYTADSYISAVNQGWGGVKQVWSSDWTNFKADVGEIIAPYTAKYLSKISESLPEILNVIQEKLPPVLENGEQIIQRIGQKIEEWKPNLEWILEHWKQIATAVGIAYAGMGAFRLGTSAVETGLMLQNLTKGISKQSAAASAIAAKSSPAGWIAANTISEVGTGATYGLSNKVGNITPNGNIRGVGLKTTLAEAERGASKTVSSMGSEALNYKGIPIYSVSTPKNEMYEGGSFFKKIGKGALKSAAAGEAGMATTTAVGATTLGGATAKAGATLGGAAAGTGATAGLAGIASTVAIVTAVVATIALAIKNSKMFRDSLKEIGTTAGIFLKPIKTGFEKAKEAIAPAIPFAKSFFGLLGDIAGVALTCLSPFIQGLGWILGSAIGGVLEAIGTAFGFIGEKLGPVVEYIRQFIEKIETVIQKWKELIENGIIKDNVSNSQTGTSLYENKKGDGLTPRQRGMMPEVNALGTNYWHGGVTLMNERGGELVNLPNGSQIIPADQTNKIMRNAGGQPIIMFNIENFYGEDESYLNRVGEKVAGKIAEVI